jgi:Na+-driven multidrug efflux pump
MGIVFVLFSDQIFGLYGVEPRVRELGHQSLLIGGIGQAPQAMAFVLSGALRGAGDTRATLVGGVLGTCAIRAPIAYLLGLTGGLGFVGIWIAWIGDWATRSIIFGLRFRSGRWQKVRV